MDNSTKSTKSTKKIFLSYPMHHTAEIDSIISLYKALSTTSHIVDVAFSKGDSMVTRVRNGAISTFINDKKDYDYFMTIDSDLEIQNIYHGNNIFDILIDNDKDFTGGLYALKNHRLNRCASITFDMIQPLPYQGLIRMKYLSAGCQLIKREAIERIVKENQHLSYVGDGNTFSNKNCIGLYNPLIVNTTTEVDAKPMLRLLSEDWSFCHRATDVGLEMYADTSIGLIHHGSMPYSLFGYVAHSAKDIKDAKEKKDNTIKAENIIDDIIKNNKNNN